jgi:hypothetical protein
MSEWIARQTVVLASAGFVSGRRLSVAAPAGRLRAADRVRRRVSAIDRRSRVRRTRCTPEPSGPSRAGCRLHVGRFVLEALAVPVPAARPRTEAQPYDRPRRLAARDRCRAPRTAPPRPLQFRRLPRSELDHPNSRRPPHSRPACGSGAPTTEPGAASALSGAYGQDDRRLSTRARPLADGLAAESWRMAPDRFAESWEVAAADRQNPRFDDRTWLPASAGYGFGLR